MTAEGEERKEGKDGGKRRTSDVGSSLQLPVLAVYRAEEVEGDVGEDPFLPFSFSMCSDVKPLSW